MFVKFILALINYVFDLPHRQVEFFRQAVERDSIKKPSFEDLSVPLGVSANYPIVNSRLDLGSG